MIQVSLLEATAVIIFYSDKRRVTYTVIGWYTCFSVDLSRIKQPLG